MMINNIFIINNNNKQQDYYYTVMQNTPPLQQHFSSSSSSSCRNPPRLDHGLKLMAIVSGIEAVFGLHRSYLYQGLYRKNGYSAKRNGF